ncbi:unnamed protein product [Linum trigynum]|uniref:Uncharacterized protein n=1 Tax=Linum trigynum TaxID=586398 RepID=A0AAV2DTD0_9ROSI
MASLKHCNVATALLLAIVLALAVVGTQVTVVEAQACPVQLNNLNVCASFACPTPPLPASSAARRSSSSSTTPSASLSKSLLVFLPSATSLPLAAPLSN